MRFLLVLMVCLLSVLTVSSALRAEEFRDRPAVTVQLAAVDDWLNDIRRLGTLADSTRLEELLKSKTRRLPQLQGISRDAPIGLFLYFPTAGLKPEVAVAIPIRDRRLLAEELRNQLKLPGNYSAEAELWQLDLPQRKLHVKFQAGYACVSENAALIEHLAASPALRTFSSAGKETSRANLGEEHALDLSVAIFPAEFPEFLITALLTKAEQDMERDLAKQTEDSPEEHALRVELGELVMKFLEVSVTETERLELDYRFADDVDLQLRWQAKPDSALSTAFANLPISPSRLSSAGERPPLYAAAAVKLPATLQSFLLQALKLASDNIQQELEGKLKEGDQHAAGEVYRTLTATLRQGTLSAAIEFIPTAIQHMSLVTAIELAEPDGMATTLKTVLPYARDSEQAADVSLNFLERDGLTLHRVVGNEVRPGDKDLYGPEIALYVGTGANAGWLAVGGVETSDFIEQRNELPPLINPPLIRGTLTLTPWIALALRHNEDDALLRLMLRSLSGSDKDQLQLTLERKADQLLLSLHADQGIPRCAAAIIDEILKRRDAE